MLAATFLAIFFVPLFYKIITDRKVAEHRSKRDIVDEAELARARSTGSIKPPVHTTLHKGDFND